MNAHINFDLPFALVTTFDHLESEPVDGSDQHHDYLEINNIFADKIPGLRRGYLERWQLLIDMLNGDIDDWYQGELVEYTRDVAWRNAQKIWRCRHDPDARECERNGWTTTPRRSAGCCSRPSGRSCSSRTGAPRAPPRGGRRSAGARPTSSTPRGRPRSGRPSGTASRPGGCRPSATVGRPGGCRPAVGERRRGHVDGGEIRGCRRARNGYARAMTVLARRRPAARPRPARPGPCGRVARCRGPPPARRAMTGAVARFPFRFDPAFRPMLALRGSARRRPGWP